MYTDTVYCRIFVINLVQSLPEFYRLFKTEKTWRYFAVKEIHVLIDLLHHHWFKTEPSENDSGKGEFYQNIKKQAMRVTYFFRKPLAFYHSIEELFTVIQKHLPDNIHFRNYAVKRESTDLQSIFHNAREVKKYQGDVNHITGDIHYVAMFLNKRKTILTIHDLVPLTRGPVFKRRFIKFVWYDLPVRKVRYVTVISEFTKKELLKRVSLSERKVKVIPNTVSPEFRFSPKLFNKSKPVFLQVGTKPNKNINRVVSALMGVDCHLIILGKLSEKQRLFLDQSGVDYSNRYNISYRGVIEAYREVDALLFVSTYEGFGMPILEAQATGRPVICSNVTSLPYVAGDAALLVDPYDIQAIHGAIMRLLSDDQMRRRLVENGRQNAERFKPESIARQYAVLYEQIVKETKEKGAGAG